MNKQRIFVDVHVLQTVPPSCVNRDDTGSPKTAVYGGVRRARVSSQAWKKAMRETFKELFPKEQLSLRTKRIVDMVSQEMEKIGGFSDAPQAAQAVLKTAGLNIKSQEKGTDALFFLSRAQAKALAQLAKEKPQVLGDKPAKSEKSLAQQALRENPGIDIALFGRMVADDPSLNTDACAQVAHAISTHQVNNEYDYFTAVDDLAPEDNAGAGHIGTVEFNSSTLYRYATLAVHELFNTLDEDTIQAVKGFIRAFVFSMPTGKQNTFANRTLPDALLVTVRENQPVNLVGAFEKPINAREEGYVALSEKRLVEHASHVYKDFAGNPTHSFVVGEGLNDLGERGSFEEILNHLDVTLTSILEDINGTQA